MLAEQFLSKSVGSSIQVTSHVVAALVVILLWGTFAQGKGSSGLMIPPRHRPYFETKHLPPQDAHTTANDVSLYSYDVTNSLYQETPTKNMMWGSSFVDKTFLYSDHVIRRRDDKDVSQADKCKEFELGNPERREFYSPNYPGNYTKNTECVKLLEVEPGYLLRLDFRNKFDMEYSNNCTYDYLEIRDGGHGYDRLKKKLCGSTFPQIIESTSRFLWLRFKSDDTIEGGGFTAVYEAFRPDNGGYHIEMPTCQIFEYGYEGWLNITDISPSYLEKTSQMTKPIDCMWIVNVTEGWKIQLVFKFFDLNKPNDCDNNFVDIFSPNTEIESRVKTFCGSIAETVSSSNNVLYVRFYADWKARNSTFSALFTAYRDISKKDSKNGGDCVPEEEFDCQDERCIKKELECNGVENCRFRWDDDDHCVPKTGTLADTLKEEHIIIILVIFCLILSGMCFTFIFNCVRKLIHDHRIIQDHMRQSRQSRLDQVGKSQSLDAPKVATAGRSRSNSSSAGGGVSPHHILRAVLSDAHIPRESPHRGPGPEECYVPGAGDLLPILLGASATTDTRAVTATVPANGDAVFLRNEQNQERAYDEEDDDLDMSTFPPPEMRDNECQTRESLFMNTNSDRSLTPPPPPPPATSRNRPTPQQNLPPHHSSSNTSAFSTFGYNKDHPHGSSGSSILKDSSLSSRTATLPSHHHHHHRHHQHPVSPESQRFRAEAVIEMEQMSPRRDTGDVPPPPPPISVPPPPVGSRPFSVESTKSAPDVIVTH